MSVNHFISGIWSPSMCPVNSSIEFGTLSHYFLERKRYFLWHMKFCWLKTLMFFFFLEEQWDVGEVFSTVVMVLPMSCVAKILQNGIAKILHWLNPVNDFLSSVISSTFSHTNDCLSVVLYKNCAHFIQKCCPAFEFQWIWMLFQNP